MANLRASGWRPASRHPLTEVRRLRAELAEVLKQRDEARAALITYPDPSAPSSLRQAARAAYEGGHSDGYRSGYAQAGADMAAAWRESAYPVARPEAHRREMAERGLRAAKAGERRDQGEHEQAFIALAYNTPAHLRSEVQQAAVLLYPPPERALGRRGIGRVAGG